ncbi:HGGxSTG domain-containing protein [Crenobacter sp. SG2305]|uniref:HGGxSTG domain-containing protein n=1 Tax=Crenobacter oryzisoli TaxID=3056844 RepID=UPI0025AB4D20|nr:HGGxSTG domain-containing protein [Crenobacter sp. SG2305]MDN0085428.1 HGGxSTG domain-containing protein [Crenobacter sp. SG2305]
MEGAFYLKLLPVRLRGPTCGAKTRAGTPCQHRNISKRNGRCKLHGGASTGPRTKEVKARVSRNLGAFANRLGLFVGKKLIDLAIECLLKRSNVWEWRPPSTTNRNRNELHRSRCL